MDTAIASDGGYEISWISENYLKFIIKKSPVKTQTTTNTTTTTTNITTTNNTTNTTNTNNNKKSPQRKRERLQLDTPTSDKNNNNNNNDNTTEQSTDKTENSELPIKMDLTTEIDKMDSSGSGNSKIQTPELINSNKKKQKKQTKQQEQQVDSEEQIENDDENEDKGELEIKSMDKLILNPPQTTTTTTTTTTPASDATTTTAKEEDNKKQEEEEEDLQYNGNTVLGTRDENQDSFFHKFIKHDNTRIIGVFDGHGDDGMDASITTRDIVSDCLEKDILSSVGENGGNANHLESYIGNSFSVAHQKLLEKGKVSGDWGTTATLAIINGNNIKVGWVGDSMAVLFKNNVNNNSNSNTIATRGSQMDYTPIQLSNDHKPENTLEKKRIISTGGRVVFRCACWRVIPNKNDYTNDEIMKQRLALNMSRALGHIVLNKYGVSSEPDFQQHDNLSPGDIVILASDGLWNVLDFKTIVKFIKKTSSTKELTDLLLSTVESKCTNFKIPCDNVTICCYKHT